MEDNYIFKVNYYTPKYNDYGEWGIEEIFITENEYSPENNLVEPASIKDFNLQVSDKQYEAITQLSTYFNNFNNDNKEIDYSKIEDYDIDYLFHGGFIDDKFHIIYPNEERKQMTSINDFNEKFVLYPLFLETMDVVVKRFTTGKVF